MAGNFLENLRTQYARLIDGLTAVGEQAHARACADLAVQHGVWKHPLQRPTDYDASLPAQPTYDPARFWFVPYLEERFPIIQAEVSRVLDPRQAGFSEVDEPLVGVGRWDEAIFYEAGVRMEQSCVRFPQTAAIMEKIPESIASSGVVMLSWLHPGTHIVPHCGATNRRLRVHMGLRIPAGARMRVGDEQIVWQEGKCVVFDDSFEHEVWNAAAQPRLILLFDINHPDRPAPQAASVADDNGLADFETTVKSFLAARGIVGVERDPSTDELTVFPDLPTARTITRYMKDHNVTRVQMEHGALVIE